MAEKNEKSPYKNHSIEEVVAVETGFYYIQIGEDMFESESGKLAFNKDRAESIYTKVWEGIKHMKKEGTEQERKDAENILLHFRIIPLRFH
jgi:hypothetical protein